MSNKKTGGASLIIIWTGALAISLLGFYLLDHGIMSMQGLPLNLDLTPAQ